MSPRVAARWRTSRRIPGSTATRNRRRLMATSKRGSTRLFADVSEIVRIPEGSDFLVGLCLRYRRHLRLCPALTSFHRVSAPDGWARYEQIQSRHRERTHVAQAIPRKTFVGLDVAGPASMRFQDRCLQPLGHPSNARIERLTRALRRTVLSLQSRARRRADAGCPRALGRSATRANHAVRVRVRRVERLADAAAESRARSRG